MSEAVGGARNVAPWPYTCRMREITQEQARTIALGAGLLDDERPADVVEVAEQLGRIKIDPTNVVAPAEHMMMFSRIGEAYSPGDLKKALETDRTLFEYDGMIYPATLLPALYGIWRGTPRYPRNLAWLEGNRTAADEVLAELRAQGPSPASALKPRYDVKFSDTDGWYGPNATPRLLEAMSRRGEVAVAGRQGRNRVWDLAERVHGEAFGSTVSGADGLAELQRRTLGGLGIVRTGGGYHRITDVGERVTVTGLPKTYQVDEHALQRAIADAPPGRVAILNPYDWALFDREKLQRIFDFDYKLEQFKKPHERVYGYFAHPILVGDRFPALMDAAVDRKENVLRIGAIHELDDLEPEEREMIEAELAALARWLGVRLTDEPAAT